MNDEDDYELYSWKTRQRQLDPDSRRTFQGIVWMMLAGVGLLVVVGLVA